MSAESLSRRIEQARETYQSVNEQIIGAKSLLAGGIFQELKYRIPKKFPGGQPGTTSKFMLSFRYGSGFGYAKSTSPFVITRFSPPLSAGGKKWVGLRLDYGWNKSTQTTNWHWNQKGTHSIFGKQNHIPPSRGVTNVGRVLRAAKPLGRAAWIAGAAMDAVSLGSEIHESTQTGNWDNTVVEGSRVTGGWGGAFLGAKLFGMGGAAIGTAICPGPGTAIGGAIGGLIGGAVGYFSGSEAGEAVGEEITD